MYGVPAGHRQVTKYKIARLSFSDKPDELHCFGYQSPRTDDWIWSTTIQLDSIQIVREKMDGTFYRFRTKSGSEYLAYGYDESPINYPSEERLTGWFNADSMRVLTEQEWKEIVNAKED